MAIIIILLTYLEISCAPPNGFLMSIVSELKSIKNSLKSLKGVDALIRWFFRRVRREEVQEEGVGSGRGGRLKHLQMAIALWPNFGNIAFMFAKNCDGNAASVSL